MGNNSHTIHLSPSEIYTILRLGGCEATHTPSGVSARFYRQGDLQTCPVLSSLFLSTGFLPDEFSEIIGSEGVDFTKILVVTESRLTDEAKRKLVEFFGPKASEIKVGSLEIGGRCIRLNLRNKKGGHYKSTYELFNRDFNPPESYRESLKEWRRRLHDEFRSLQAEERHDKARKEDIREVERAIRILQRFQSACEDQYRRLRGTMTSDADLRESNVHGKHIRGRSVQVTDKAEVSGQASVSDNATVSDFALVNGYAKVSDNASVAEFSVVSGNTSVSGCAFIQEHSHVSGNAVVRDRAVVSEHAHVYEHAVVHGESIVEGMARIKGSAKIGGTSVVSGKTTVSGNASVSGAANVSGRSSILGNASVSEEASVSGCAIVTGNASVSGKALVHGYAVVTGNARISGDAVILGGTWDGSEGEITSGRWLSPKVSAML